MSRLWTEPASLYLSPSGMALSQPAKRATAQNAVHLAAGFDPASEGLRHLLTTAQVPPSRLHVVLSNHFCRFQLVLPQPGLRTEAEILAWSAFRFESDAGLASGSFVQRLARLGANSPAVACAIDQALLQAIDTGIGSIPVVSIEPLFVAVFNACRKQLSGRAMLAVVEPGRIVLGRIAKGEWNLLVSRFIDTANRGALQDLLADYCDEEKVPADLWVFDPSGQVELPKPGSIKLHHVSAEAVKPAAIAVGLAA